MLLGGVGIPLAPELWHTYHSLRLACEDEICSGWEDAAAGSCPESEDGDTREGMEDS